MEMNDNVKMLTDSDWWTKGDIGRLVEISYNRHGRALYLVCFDSNCHKCMIRMVGILGMPNLICVNYTGQID